MGKNETISYEDRLALFRQIIDESQKIVFFGGAGVSTASGIPDFRSVNGLYNTKDEEFVGDAPEYLLSSACFNHDTKKFFRFYRKYMDVRKYEPNVVHKKLAELEKAGKMLGIVTQNVDMLHEKAGSEKVFKIHGTISENYCIQCGEEYGIDFIFENTDSIPRCPNCNGHCNYVKPKVVLYGENLPYDAKCNAYDVITDADCMIVAGTSLAVQPAASFVGDWFVDNMKRKGSKLIILNRDEIAYEDKAHVVFREDMNKVFNDL